MPALSALGEIEAMRGTLTMARALVEAGRVIDLAGLDRQAAGLCRQVAALPPGGGQAVKSALVALMRDVQALAATLPDPSDPAPAPWR